MAGEVPNIKHVLLTGLPGCGKTTLIMKICNMLRQRSVSAAGFYTVEMRSNGKRIGFDVVNLNGLRAPLARIRSPGSNPRAPSVGNYIVNISSFEEAAFPAMSEHLGITVIDEIGRMELLSSAFSKKVIQLFHDPTTVMLATIPAQRRGRPIPLVESLRQNPRAQVIEVTAVNRDRLKEEIVHTLEIAYRNK